MYRLTSQQQDYVICKALPGYFEGWRRGGTTGTVVRNDGAKQINDYSFNQVKDQEGGAECGASKIRNGAMASSRHL